jgi:hypothetical protein
LFGFDAGGFFGSQALAFRFLTSGFFSSQALLFRFDTSLFFSGGLFLSQLILEARRKESSFRSDRPTGG